MLLLSLLLGATPVCAQDSSEPGALITAVDADNFPQVTAYLLVNDAGGHRVPGLTAQDMRLIENGNPVGNLTVTERAVGVQVVFVLDSTDAFGARDVNAVTRLEYLQQALVAYAQEDMRPGIDDVTVLASEGPVVTHSDDPGLVIRAVQGYTSTFAGVADPFTLINWGLDLASDVTRRPGMRPQLIFISNGLPRPDSAGFLADAATRAAAAQVPMTTLFVGPPGAEATTGATNLRRLAELTGGLSLTYTGAESLAPFVEHLAEQGQQYALVYRSALAVTGQHRLSAQVTLSGAKPLAGGETITATDVVFPLRVEPPALSFGALPPSVVRVASSAEADPAAAEPAALEVPLIVDFPDGHQRGLHSLELLVDGEIVASLSAAPSITMVTWPLSDYAGSGEHVLQAHLVDELGLAAESEEARVTVTLQVPAAPVPVPAPVRWLAQPGAPLLAMALSGLLLAVGVGVVAWWGLTRADRARAALAEDGGEDDLQITQAAAPVRPGLPPGAATRPGRTARATVARSSLQVEAGAQPADRRAVPAGRWHLPSVSLPPLRWPGRGAGAQACAAYLEVVEPGGGGAPRLAIELPAGPITLGRDAAMAEAVFHDRSVSRLHARILPVEGGFRLFDAGSTSGTWVNYAPLPAETGHDLQPGDLINLGRVQLRFKRRDAANHGANCAPVVKVTPACPASVPPASGDEKSE
ncbi:MAG: FHA domain-containing protein [Anaerolineales bacterium]|nr:FHA domain-containing protein [Anaerolineales bacterium]